MCSDPLGCMPDRTLTERAPFLVLSKRVRCPTSNSSSTATTLPGIYSASWAFSLNVVDWAICPNAVVRSGFPEEAGIQCLQDFLDLVFRRSDDSGRWEFCNLTGLRSCPGRLKGYEYTAITMDMARRKEYKASSVVAGSGNRLPCRRPKIITARTFRRPVRK